MPCDSSLLRPEEQQQPGAPARGAAAVCCLGRSVGQWWLRGKAACAQSQALLRSLLLKQCCQQELSSSANADLGQESSPIRLPCPVPTPGLARPAKRRLGRRNSPG